MPSETISMNDEKILKKNLDDSLPKCDYKQLKRKSIFD